MSGGFFRGTSADQDTRFSNKQAKLLKSQKFAPELENLVDMTKVKMDVMRPWIAHRVTELLGFEDEVLINFIYGLLEEKVVNGKKIQISLTGFMEKNTGKFMKELWTLLLSAQKNASGVPQEFLDAKEEETRKKKAETDRITSEIQRKKEKEGRELEQEKMKKTDGDVDSSRSNNAALQPTSRHQARDSSTWPADDKEADERNGSRRRRRVSGSSHSAERSSLSPRGTPSRSVSKSYDSRSHSNERHRARSISGSPQPGGRSISNERLRRSPSRLSVTPRRRDSPPRSLSPPRRESSHFRRRSVSRSRHRSPSPVRRRWRSPIRRRSRSPIRRRSRSPIRRRSRSPVRRRLRSPVRRRSRSPMRYRSRSPVRRRSRSPLWRRSQSPMQPGSPPGQRRSPSPMRRRYRRAPSTPRRRSPSPLRHRPTISGRRRSSSPKRRSSSPQEWSSQSPIRRLPPSPVARRSPKRQRRSPVQSPREGPRTFEKDSRVRRAPLIRENAEHLVGAGKGLGSLERQHPVSIRSPQKDPRDRNGSRNKVPALPSPYKSPSNSESPPAARKRSPGERRRYAQAGKASGSLERQHPVSVSSPQKDPRDRNGSGNKVPALPFPYKTLSSSESPPAARKRSPGERRRSSSPYEGPVEQTRERIISVSSPSSPLKSREAKPIIDSPASMEAEKISYAREKENKKSNSIGKRIMHLSTADEHKDSVEKPHYKNEYSPKRLARCRSGETWSHADNIDLRKDDQKTKSNNVIGRVPHSGFTDKESPNYRDNLSNVSVWKLTSGEGFKAVERSHSRTNDVKGNARHYKSDNVIKLSKKVEGNDRSPSVDSASEESDKQRAEVDEKKKHKKLKRKDVASDDDDSYDSHIQERNEAKKRRKEEKRLRKEEKRRRREERRCRREDRRAEKLKLKSVVNVTPPSDPKKNPDGYASDGEHVARRELRATESEEAESEQKKLEMELRIKAIESIKAKKGIGH